MNRLLMISILFFTISSSSYSQEKTSDINRLVNIINSDSLTGRIIDPFVTQTIKRAEKQIQGAGAKEKLDTYTKFIKTTSAEISKSAVDIEMPKIYSNHFTPDEIKDLIVFYETPTGKKLLLESPQITKELMKAFYEVYIPNFQQKLKKELARLDSKIWREAYRVKPEQVTVYEGDFSRVKKLIRIKNKRRTKETYVTFAVPIHDNKWWIRFDKNIEIIDKNSSQHYQVIRLDKDLVLNKTMIVSDQKNKMIEVTMVFPLLKNSVEEIEIVEKISDDADLMSNNGGGDDNNLSNIKVKDYLVK